MKVLFLISLVAITVAEVTQVTDQGQIDLVLKLHNEERAKNSLPPVVLSPFFLISLVAIAVAEVTQMTDQGQIDLVLKLHNEERAKNSLPPVVLSPFFLISLVAIAVAEVTQMTDQGQIDLVLKLHNEERAKNSLPPVVLSPFFLISLVAIAVAEVTQMTGQGQIDLVLKLHNDERAKNNLPPVEWDAELAAFAAEKVVPMSCDSGTLVHSEDPNTGENLAANSQSDPTKLITDGVEGWISELQWYNYDANSCSAPAGKACGHYTQVVWDVSTAVGCAIATDCSGNYGNVFGCNYKKKGNMCSWKPYGRSQDEMCNCEGNSLCSPDGLFADPYNTLPCQPGEESKEEDGISATRTISCSGGCIIQYSYQTSSMGGSGNFMVPAKAGEDVTCPASYLEWSAVFNKIKSDTGHTGGSGGDGGGDGGAPADGGSNAEWVIPEGEWTEQVISNGGDGGAPADGGWSDGNWNDAEWTEVVVSRRSADNSDNGDGIINDDGDIDWSNHGQWIIEEEPEGVPNKDPEQAVVDFFGNV